MNERTKEQGTAYWALWFALQECKGDLGTGHCVVDKPGHPRAGHLKLPLSLLFSLCANLQTSHYSLEMEPSQDLALVGEVAVLSLTWAMCYSSGGLSSFLTLVLFSSPSLTPKQTPLPASPITGEDAPRLLPSRCPRQL